MINGCDYSKGFFFFSKLNYRLDFIEPYTDRGLVCWWFIFDYVSLCCHCKSCLIISFLALPSKTNSSEYPIKCKSNSKKLFKSTKLHIKTQTKHAGAWGRVEIINIIHIDVIYLCSHLNSILNRINFSLLHASVVEEEWVTFASLRLQSVIKCVHFDVPSSQSTPSITNVWLHLLLFQS